MTISVTITKPGVTNEYGIALTVGTSYALADDFANTLLSQLKAVRTVAQPTPPGGQSQPGNVIFVNSAAIANPTAQMLANYQALYALDVAPFTRYYSNGVALVASPIFEYINGVPFLASAGLSMPAVIPVLTPSGYRWTTHGLTLRRSLSGAISTDFDITTLIPAVTNIWYVDPLNGNDGTAVVNTRASPLLNLATALAKTDVDQIRIINLTADFFGRTTKSWNNIQPSRNVSVIVEGNYRYVSIAAGSATLPTWAVNGTYSNVYSTTIAAASANGVSDLLARVAHPTNPQMTTANLTVLASVKRPYRTLVKVASLAAVAATPGTWYHDGTQLHVRAQDDRNLVGGVYMQPTSNGNGLRFTTTSDRVIYVQGIDFVGGRPAYATVAESAAISGMVLAANDCTFQGGGVANGLAVEMDMTVYLYRCGAMLNWNDGFNYHCPTAPAAAGLDTSPNVYEIECVAWGNGTTGSSATSYNASTAHEYSNVIRIGCVHANSDDRPVADINFVNSWMLGGYVGQAIKTGAGSQDVVALDTAEMWLDSVILETGTNDRINADGTATIYQFNLGNLSNTSGATGTVRAYLG